MILWGHCLCQTCWEQLHDWEPARVVERKKEYCCVCGVITESGIYWRHDPNLMPCKGNHLRIEEKWGNPVKWKEVAHDIR